MTWMLDRVGRHIAAYLQKPASGYEPFTPADPEALKALIRPGDMIRVTTRRGTVELNSRQDDGIPDGVVFIPFAYVEAAANILTNPALDPFGKIPEFKFCAAKVEPAKMRMEAAE